MFDRIVTFLKEVKLESSKVTWPTWNELRESTIVVIIAVAVISAFIAVVDRVLAFVVQLVI